MRNHLRDYRRLHLLFDGDAAKQALGTTPQQPAPSEDDRQAIDDRTVAVMEPKGNTNAETTPIGENTVSWVVA